MLSIVTCTNCCSKSGYLQAEASFRFNWRVCGECKHSQDIKWTYSFCDIFCLTTWLRDKDIEAEGLPCRYCDESGWQGGYKANGICTICNGETRVKI